MEHEIYIVSIDENRGSEAAAHIRTLGFKPMIIDGVDVNTVTAPDLSTFHLSIRNLANRYTNGDIGEAMRNQDGFSDLYRREKIAILRAMRYATSNVRAGTVIQDDYRFPAVPVIGDQPLVAWNGDTYPGHYCPKAFTFNEAIGELLVNAWSDERHNACDGWLPIIRKHKVEPTWQ